MKQSAAVRFRVIIGVIPIDLDIVIWNNNIIREKDFNQKYFQIGWHQLNK